MNNRTELIRYIKSGEAHVILKDLPTTVRGCVFRDAGGNPCILLNSRLTREANMKTILHEANHIVTGQIDDLSYEEYDS